MAGSRPTSWTFSSRTLIAGAMVVAESAWVSLLVNAAVNGSPGPHVHLPFLVFAIPAVTAAAVSAASGRLGWRWWWQGAVLAPAVVAGAAVTAGLTSLLTRSGSFWPVAVQPWTATGHPAAVTAGASWFVAGLAWARGTWLGIAPPSLRQAAWSVGLGGAAFVGVFAGRADVHSTAFRAATGPAGWLLFVAFPFATAAVALIREHDLEVQVLLRARSQPGTVWLTVLAAPMVGVALVALLLAVIVGPVAPVAGRAAARVGAAIWWVVTTAFDALGRLLPGGHAHPAVLHTQPAPPPSAPALPPPAHTTALPSPIVWQILAGVVVVGLIVVIIRYVRPSWPARWRRRDVADDEERDSVFTWRHLASQLLNVLRGLLGRLRRPPHRGGRDPATLTVADEPGGAETVRQAYRRMLIAARTSGSARAATETTRELEDRLSRGPAESAAGALSGLTTLYDAVRYGELETADAARDDAVTQADMVSLALARTASPEPPSSPAPGPPVGRSRRPTPPSGP